MDPEPEAQEIERAARDGADRVSRLHRTAERVDTNPALLQAARRVRRRLPGDELFGDPLSTAGQTPVEVVARGVSALGLERESVGRELGLAGLQLWQSLSESAGRGRGDTPLAILFTDLVAFSSWPLQAGDKATVALLREVGTGLEKVIVAHQGRIVKRLGDGVMATFLDAQAAVHAALEAQDAVGHDRGRRDRPRMRAGVHWGCPRKLGGDYMGVDVNIAARVGDAAKAEQLMVSDPALDRLAGEGLKIGRRRRLRADGAPRGLCVASLPGLIATPAAAYRSTSAGPVLPVHIFVHPARGDAPDRPTVLR